jgi:uncharacterized protein (TIGR02996 family)
MNQDEAFLAAIRETPDDDAPRLVYADWLDDHGDPARGEFIRSGCAAKRFPEWSEERGRAEERASRLFIEHGSRWLGEPPEGLENSLVERGFWSQLTFPTVSEYLAAVKQWPLHHLAPVQTLRLKPKPGTAGLGRLFDSPALRWVDSLTLDDAKFNDKLARKLASSPHAHGLRSLIVEDGRGLKVSGVSALLAEGALPSLIELDLSSARLGDNGLRQLARLPGLARLRRLRLIMGGFGDAGAAALIESPHLAPIEELGLGCLNFDEPDTRIGDSTLAVLSRPGCLPALRKLRLHQAQAQPEAWQGFARSPLAGRLSHLDLDQTPLDAREVEALFHKARLKLGSLGLGVLRCDQRALELLLRSPVVRGLRKLDLSSVGEDFGARGARLLAEGPPLKHLRELHLNFNSLGDAGAEALADGNVLSGLRVLALFGNQIGPSGAARLAGSRALKGITDLRLFNNRLGNKGLAALESATFAGSLRSLSLGYNGLTEGGIARLAQSSKFPALCRLHLNENPLGVKGARAILKSPLFASLQTLTLLPDDVPEGQLDDLQRLFGARLYLMTDADYD